MWEIVGVLIQSAIRKKIGSYDYRTVRVITRRMVVGVRWNVKFGSIVLVGTSRNWLLAVRAVGRPVPGFLPYMAVASANGLGVNSSGRFTQSRWILRWK